MSVKVLVCDLPLAVAVMVKVDVPAGVPGFGVGVGVEPELPLAQPPRSMVADTGSSSKPATKARRTVRIRPAGLCIHASMTATESSARRKSGTVRIAAGGCILGSDCTPGATIALAVVETVMEKAAGPAGVTTTGVAGALQVASEGAPAQVTVTLNESVRDAAPVSESCRL